MEKILPMTFIRLISQGVIFSPVLDGDGYSYNLVSNQNHVLCGYRGGVFKFASIEKAVNWQYDAILRASRTTKSSDKLKTRLINIQIDTLAAYITTELNNIQARERGEWSVVMPETSAPEAIKLFEPLSAPCKAHVLAVRAAYVSEWQGTDNIEVFDVNVTVSTAAALNTAIVNARNNPALKTRIVLASNYADDAATALVISGGALQLGNWIDNGGALLIRSETRQIITSQLTINGAAGVQIENIHFARDMTHTGGNINWVAGDAGADPQNTTPITIQRTSSFPRPCVVRFVRCRIGSLSENALNWISCILFNGARFVDFKNCEIKHVYKGLICGRVWKLRVDGIDFQQVVADQLNSFGHDDFMTTFATAGANATMTAGQAVLTINGALSAQFIAHYPQGLRVGMGITGIGIAAGSTVQSWTGSATNPETITLNANTTASGINAINFQDTFRVRYQTQDVYFWVKNRTTRNTFDGANTMTQEATPRSKGYWNLHADLNQLGTGADVLNYMALIEKSMMYAERFDGNNTANIRRSAAYQGVYVDDANTQIKLAVIDTLLACDSIWGFKSWGGTQWVERCTVVRAGKIMRSANMLTDGFIQNSDNVTGIRCTKKYNGAHESFLNVRNCIAGAFETMTSTGTTNSDYRAGVLLATENLTISPQKGLNDYAQNFNGSFGLDDEGRVSYEFVDNGREPASEFIARFYNHFSLKNGALKGVTNPQYWGLVE